MSLRWSSISFARLQTAGRRSTELQTLRDLDAPGEIQ